MKDKPRGTTEVIRRVTERLLKETVDLAEVREMIPGWLEGTQDSAWWEAMLDLASALWRSGEMSIASEIYGRCLELGQWSMIRSRALLGRGIVSARQSAFKEASECMEAA